ncbi:hypothetical protein DSM112329_04714 [Paraconexibacter sp. AEG42_29]|uniref:Sigma-70 family RNA polymerase sigma factor n=2 Tax=Paraconexibacter sp. AEG42_29 TaxID=2997339 RepID=A0AAU7B1J3_9ACTN
MRLCWEEIVISIFDRVDGIVAATHKLQLDDDEHELAVEMALARISTNLMRTFRGSSMGELINAIKTLSFGICVDVQRKSQSAGRRTNRSLDAGWDADAEDRPAHTWETDEAHAVYEREGRQKDINDFLDWAYPQMADNRRAVVQLTHHGSTIPEICEELGIRRDNAYQLRKRGFADLAKLKQQYDAS